LTVNVTPAAKRETGGGVASRTNGYVVCSAMHAPETHDEPLGHPTAHSFFGPAYSAPSSDATAGERREQDEQTARAHWFPQISADAPDTL